MSTSAKSPDPEAGLATRIASEIRSGGPMAFSRFMDLALYDAAEGYYGAGRAVIGRAGDFYTNVSVGAVFGELIAGQVAEMRRLLATQGGGRFTLVEQGANDGRLARDILEAFSGMGESPPEYVIVEPVESLRERQQRTLAGCDVRWASALEELEPFDGVHLSNELFDAFPVDLARSTGAGWEELRVGLEDGQFVFLAGPDPGVEAPAMPPGFVIELRRHDRPFLEAVASRLSRGFLLTIDYGFTEGERFAPHRADGTLVCFSGHRRDDRPLEAPGTKDITAHVDFSALARTAESLGFHAAGFADQHHFLVGAATERLKSLDGHPPDARAAAFLRGFRTLVHPETMGRQFHALLLSRNFDGPTAISGFAHATAGRHRLGLSQA